MISSRDRADEILKGGAVGSALLRKELEAAGVDAVDMLWTMGALMMEALGWDAIPNRPRASAQDTYRAVRELRVRIYGEDGHATAPGEVRGPNGSTFPQSAHVEQARNGSPPPELGDLPLGKGDGGR